MRGANGVFNENGSSENALGADAPGKPTEEDGFKPPKKPTNTKDGKVKNLMARGRGRC